MNLQHIAIKIFVDGELATDWEQFINVFHTWVAQQSMPEMMIDVADYRHVPQGPGIVMVGLQADYSLDNSDGRPGLRYVNKVEEQGSNEDRIARAFAAASSACARLESEIPGLKFSRTNLQLQINDRAFAINNEETRAALGQELPGVLSQVLGSSAEIQYEDDPRKLAGATIVTASPVELAAP